MNWFKKMKWNENRDTDRYLLTCSDFTFRHSPEALILQPLLRIHWSLINHVFVCLFALLSTKFDITNEHANGYSPVSLRCRGL